MQQSTVIPAKSCHYYYFFFPFCWLKAARLILIPVIKLLMVDVCRDAELSCVRACAQPLSQRRDCRRWKHAAAWRPWSSQSGRDAPRLSDANVFCFAAHREKALNAAFWMQNLTAFDWIARGSQAALKWCWWGTIKGVKYVLQKQFN